jgi:uncharacterized protein (TIGR03663 family)
VTGWLKQLSWIEVTILALAAGLRIALLDIKPPHFDEGVNGWFADQIERTGYFRYDPTNYHGPLHFYVLFLSQTLFGRNLWALRLPAIIASLLAVWATLRFREHFGTTSVRIAALAMAVSPAYIFYGRYSIHESWLVLFSLIFCSGLLGLWATGQRRSLWMLLCGATGMILTKETYVVHIGSFLLAGAVLSIVQKVSPSQPALPFSRQHWSWSDLANGSALAALTIVFFYSGAFLEFSALSGLYETFAAWFHTGVAAAGHEKSAFQIGPLNYYWIALMARYEWPALLGFVFCFAYIFPSEPRLRYVAIYGCGVLLAYSLIPYKTPWCIISILWPFYFLLAAFATAATKPFGYHIPPAIARVVLVVSLVASTFLSVRLNFYQFANEREPYVYVQTFPEIQTLTKPLLEMAGKDPRYYHLQGHILLESYYPLPWVLGDFTRIGYYKKDEPPEPLDADFVVAEVGQMEKIEAGLTREYYKRRFRLRDSQEECVVYFAKRPFDDWFAGASPLFYGQQ